MVCRWRPGRVDPTDYAEILSRLGWPALEPALQFLAEFGGLRIRPKMTRLKCVLAICRIRYALYDYFIFGGDELFDDCLGPTENWARIKTLMGPVCPLGTIYIETPAVWMDKKGRVFAGDVHSISSVSCKGIYLMGETGDEAIETVCRSLSCKRWRGPTDS